MDPNRAYQQVDSFADPKQQVDSFQDPKQQTGSAMGGATPQPGVVGETEPIYSDQPIFLHEVPSLGSHDMTKTPS